MSDIHATRMQEIYEAVIRLLRREQDLSLMTVSGIAAEAGLGKGTVYEYFRSKEDMLAGAFLYCFDKRLKQFQEITEQTAGFEACCKTLLGMLGGQQLASIYTILIQPKNQNTLQKAFERLNGTLGENDRIDILLDTLYQKGVQEGLFPSGQPKGYIRYVFSAVCSGLCCGGGRGFTREDGVSYAYNVIVTALSHPIQKKATL